jgi:hypothetical protein
MRAALAALLIGLSLAALAFLVVKWLPVVWDDGIREAYDQLISSSLNMVSTAVQIVVGIVSFSAGVFVAPERQRSRN